MTKIVTTYKVKRGKPRKCTKHGEYIPDSTLLGCPDCAAEALFQERRERDAGGN